MEAEHGGTIDAKRLVEVSKYLSRHLRHRPERLGIELDEGGWVDVETLLRACAANAFPITGAELAEVVARNDKRRFTVDGHRIRASQGHSVPIDLGLEPVEPPEALYHGTAAPALASILASGLDRRGRHHVHLTDDLVVARRTGARHGRSVVLLVAAGAMHRDGHAFFRSDNGVWLVASVPPAYLKRIPEGCAPARRGREGG